MKIFKSAAIAFSLTAAMGSFSTAAVASEDGRTVYAPIDVINEVSSRIDAAAAAAASGADSAEVAALSKKARDFTKELNANDKVARETAKVRTHLKKAEKAAKSGDMQEAQTHFQNGKQANEGLKSLL